MICDMCSKDITSIDGREQEDARFVQTNSGKLCCCIDCSHAIGSWITSEACKKFCKKFLEY